MDMQKIVQCMLSPVLNKFDSMNVNENMNQLAESMINVYSEVSWQFNYWKATLFLSFYSFFPLHTCSLCHESWREGKKCYILWKIIGSIYAETFYFSYSVVVYCLLVVFLWLYNMFGHCLTSCWSCTKTELSFWHWFMFENVKANTFWHGLEENRKKSNFIGLRDWEKLDLNEWWVWVVKTFTTEHTSLEVIRVKDAIRSAWI